jgi:hypothetical protein
MTFWDTFSLDLICFVIAVWFFNGGLTGQFFTGGRGGGQKLIASTRSRPARVLFLLIAIGLSIWLIIDLRRKIGF